MAMASTDVPSPAVSVRISRPMSFEEPPSAPAASSDVPPVPEAHTPPGVAAEVRPGGAGVVDLSVIVPTYRDGARIYRNLCRLDAALSTLAYSYEIVVVSDGNTDETEQEITRLAAERPHIR